MTRHEKVLLASEGLKLFQDYQTKQLTVECFERQIASLEKRSKHLRNVELSARRNWHAWAADNPQKVAQIIQQFAQEPVEWDAISTVSHHEQLPDPFA